MNTTKMKTMLKSVCLLAAVAFSAAPVMARNLVELQTAHENENYDSRYVDAISTSTGNGAEQIAIKLFYVGTATEAVVTINPTGLLFYAPNNVLDTTFPAGALTAALYPTVGALCDAINVSASKYQCRMEDSRRSDSIGTLLGVTAASGLRNLKAVGGYAVAITSAANATAPSQNFLSIGINPPADTRVTLKKCTFSASGATYAQFSISGVKRVVENAPDGVVRNDSTVIWLSSAAVNTATTLSFDDAGVGGISFAAASPGITGPSSGLPLGQSTVQTTPPNSLGRVVVRVITDGTTQMGAQNYLYCQWTDR